MAMSSILRPTYADDKTTKKIGATLSVKHGLSAQVFVFTNGGHGTLTDDGTYTILGQTDATNENSFFFSTKTWLYGNFQFNIFMTEALAGKNSRLGFHKDTANTDGIYFFQEGVNPFCVCRAASVETKTATASLDFTTEHTYKIVWTSGQVLFYCDNVLKATIATNVPAIVLKVGINIQIGVQTQKCRNASVQQAATNGLRDYYDI